MWDGQMLARMNACAAEEELTRQINRTVVVVVMVPPNNSSSTHLPQGTQVRLTQLCECCQGLVLDALRR